MQLEFESVCDLGLCSQVNIAFKFTDKVDVISMDFVG